jgi:hypothetical protein
MASKRVKVKNNDQMEEYTFQGIKFAIDIDALYKPGAHIHPSHHGSKMQFSSSLIETPWCHIRFQDQTVATAASW